MRLLALTTLLLLFAVSCDDNFKSPSSYPIGQYYGHPSHSYSTGSPVGLSTYPEDAKDTGSSLDIATVQDLGDVELASGDSVGETMSDCDYPENEEYCDCEASDAETLEANLCECLHLVCVPLAEQVPELVSSMDETCKVLAANVAAEYPDLATDCQQLDNQ